MTTRVVKVWNDTTEQWENLGVQAPDVSDKAPLESPALTGVPTAPTASADTNTTQVATTGFVLGQAGSSAPLVNGSAAAGSSARFSRSDHVHPTDTSRAPTASPTFTGDASFSVATFTDGTTSGGRITSAGDTFYVQAGISSSDTGAKLNIARRSSTSTNISQLNAFADTTTFHGNIVRGTGGHPGSVSTNVFHGIAQSYATALPAAANYAEGTIIIRWA